MYSDILAVGWLASIDLWLVSFSYTLICELKAIKNTVHMYVGLTKLGSNGHQVRSSYSSHTSFMVS